MSDPTRLCSSKYLVSNSFVGLDIDDPPVEYCGSCRHAFAFDADDVAFFDFKVLYGGIGDEDFGKFAEGFRVLLDKYGAVFFAHFLVLRYEHVFCHVEGLFCHWEYDEPDETFTGALCALVLNSRPPDVFRHL